MRLVMMGTGSFAHPTLERLLASSHTVVALVTQPDRPVGNERGSTRLAEQGMKALALEHHLPVYQPESINTPEGVQVLSGYQPDLLVVAAYGQILSRNVLAAAAQGGINIHASLLPKYRGAAPIAWAIFHGETRTGVSIIRMSIHLDAGDVLAQEALDILPTETAGDLRSCALRPSACCDMAVEMVDRLAAGPVSGIQQDKSQVTKAPKLTKEDGLIDWSRPAEQVCNHIRAMQPWPTAYTFLHRASKPPLRVLVTKAKPLEGKGADLHKPGEVVIGAGEDQRMMVAALESQVEVLELQPAGKRRMSPAEFRRGNPLGPGDHFGPETP